MDQRTAWLLAFIAVILMKIVCFVLGYLTIRLGHDLIARGVAGEFKFSASFSGAKADLASVSPGLLFVLLGVGLIAYAMYVEKEVKAQHHRVTRSASSLIDEDPEDSLAMPPRAP